MSLKENIRCACGCASSSVILNVGLHVLTCVALPVGLAMLGATTVAGAVGALPMAATAAVSAGVSSIILGGWYMARYRSKSVAKKAVFLASAITLTAGSAWFNTTETAHRLHHSLRQHFTQKATPAPGIDMCDPANVCGALPAHCPQPKQQHH